MARANGVEVTELSTHLQGQLVAVHPTYDALFDGFAAPGGARQPAGAAGWADDQVRLARPGVATHGADGDGDLLGRAGLAVRLSVAAAAGGADRDGIRRAGAALAAAARRRRRERRRRLLRDPSGRGPVRRHDLRDVPRTGRRARALQHALRPVALRPAVPRLSRPHRHLPRPHEDVPRQGRRVQPDRPAGRLLRLRALGGARRPVPLARRRAGRLRRGLLEARRLRLRRLGGGGVGVRAQAPRGRGARGRRVRQARTSSASPSTPSTTSPPAAPTRRRTASCSGSADRADRGRDDNERRETRPHPARDGRRRQGRLHRRRAPDRRAHRRPVRAGRRRAFARRPRRRASRARALGLAEDRTYDDFATMAKREARRKNGIEAVAIVTPNHMHAPGGARVPEARHPRDLRQAADRDAAGGEAAGEDRRRERRALHPDPQLHRLPDGPAGAGDGGGRHARQAAGGAGRVRPGLAGDAARGERPEAGRLAHRPGAHRQGRLDRRHRHPRLQPRELRHRAEARGAGRRPAGLRARAGGSTTTATCCCASTGGARGMLWCSQVAAGLRERAAGCGSTATRAGSSGRRRIRTTSGTRRSASRSGC